MSSSTYQSSKQRVAANKQKPVVAPPTPISIPTPATATPNNSGFICRAGDLTAEGVTQQLLNHHLISIVQLGQLKGVIATKADTQVGTSQTIQWILGEVLVIVGIGLPLFMLWTNSPGLKPVKPALYVLNELQTPSIWSLLIAVGLPALLIISGTVLLTMAVMNQSSRSAWRLPRAIAARL